MREVKRPNTTIAKRAWVLRMAKVRTGLVEDIVSEELGD
jgi:hypothetical protein